MGQGKESRIRLDLLIHDLKVPLSVAEAGVESLLTRQEKYGPLTPKQEKALHRVLRNTRLTRQLVADALELGRAEAGILRPSPVPVSQLLIGSLTEIFDLAHAKTADAIRGCENLSDLRELLAQRDLILSIEEGLWCQTLRLDLPKLSQILRNLLNNALKHRNQRMELMLEMLENRLFISVKDDGKGIPAQYHQRIFDSYFQLDPREECPPRGHGLGLAGVMVLVEDLGGSLSLESDTGQGAVFVVELPV